MNAPTFYGIGIGPGDPGLITLRGHQLISSCSIIAYLCNTDGHSMARTIAADSIAQNSCASLEEIAISMPMRKQRNEANRRYDAAAERLNQALVAGKDVAFLCEGDPFYFGSFAYLHERIAPIHPTIVVPGITAMNAASAIASRPLAMLKENLVVLSGRHADEKIMRSLSTADSVVIMKAGSQRQRLLGLIAAAGRTREGYYIEYAGHSQQRIIKDLSTIEPGDGPYFSMILLHRERNTRGE